MNIGSREIFGKQQQDVKRLQYITIGNGAYFDTKWCPNFRTDSIDTELRILKYNAEWDSYFACYDYAANQAFIFRRQSTNFSTHWYLTPSSQWASASYSTGAWMRCYVDQTSASTTVLHCGSSSRSFTKPASYKFQTSLAVGAMHILQNSAYAYNYATSEFDIKGFICKSSDVIVHNFIPVLNNDVPCFYDEVTQQFFCNGGTGQFIAGPHL